MTYSIRTAHVSEDALELYALEQVNESELPALEEHLLVCAACQDRLETTDQYVRGMKAAMKELKSQPVQPTILERMVQWLPAVPKPVIGFGLAAAMAAFFVVQMPKATVESVDLSATRSVASGAHVSSKSIPELRLAAEGLSPASTYLVEVVDNSGKELWEANATPKDNKIVASLHSRLSAGQYWVRIYSDSDRKDLVREFSLFVD